jgi:phage gp36-like protein
MTLPKMKRKPNRITLFCCAIALAGSVLWLVPQRTPKPPLPAETKYQRAIEILKEFVQAGDLQLGFTDTAEMANAIVDTNHGFPAYRQIIDSLKLYGMDTTAAFEIHRTVYPIVVGSVRHSYVAFDSVFDSLAHSNHWAPVMFTDGRIPSE